MRQPAPKPLALALHPCFATQAEESLARAVTVVRQSPQARGGEPLPGQQLPCWQGWQVCFDERKYPGEQAAGTENSSSSVSTAVSHTSEPPSMAAAAIRPVSFDN